MSSQQAHDITVRLATAIQQPARRRATGPVAFTPSEMVAIVAPNLADNRIVASIVSFADSTGCCQVVLAERDQLPFVWQHVDLIRTAAIVLPIASLVGRRRRAGRLPPSATHRRSCCRSACCSSGWRR